MWWGFLLGNAEISSVFLLVFEGRGAHCFHMEVKVVVLNAIYQNYNKIADFFEVILVPYASLCLGNYLEDPVGIWLFGLN